MFGKIGKWLNKNKTWLLVGAVAALGAVVGVGAICRALHPHVLKEVEPVLLKIVQVVRWVCSPIAAVFASGALVGTVTGNAEQKNNQITLDTKKTDNDKRDKKDQELLDQVKEAQLHTKKAAEAAQALNQQNQQLKQQGQQILQQLEQQKQQNDQQKRLLEQQNQLLERNAQLSAERHQQSNLRLDVLQQQTSQQHQQTMDKQKLTDDRLKQLQESTNQLQQQANQIQQQGNLMQRDIIVSDRDRQAGENQIMNSQAVILQKISGGKPIEPRQINSNIAMNQGNDSAVPLINHSNDDDLAIETTPVAATSTMAFKG